jgi:Fe-Mn family superoxide dismutase
MKRLAAAGFSAALLAVLVAATVVPGNSAPPPDIALEQHKGPYTLAPLPFAANALNPVIDTATMEIHHGKHHQAYVTNLNAALDANPALKDKSLGEMFAQVSTLDPALRNNAGGHWNHTLFWRTMAPPGKSGAPSGTFRAQIEKDFGSLEAFKKAFQDSGMKQFGAGWVWLIWADEKLQITTTPNQDNPLMDVAPKRGKPILGNDLWEHAYYLKHQNRRDAYLAAWWDVVNWTEVTRQFYRAAAVPG